MLSNCFVIHSVPRGYTSELGPTTGTTGTTLLTIGVSRCAIKQAPGGAYHERPCKAKVSQLQPMIGIDQQVLGPRRAGTGTSAQQAASMHLLQREGLYVTMYDAASLRCSFLAVATGMSIKCALRPGRMADFEAFHKLPAEALHLMPADSAA